MNTTLKAGIAADRLNAADRAISKVIADLASGVTDDTIAAAKTLQAEMLQRKSAANIGEAIPTLQNASAAGLANQLARVVDGGGTFNAKDMANAEQLIKLLEAMRR